MSLETHVSLAIQLRGKDFHHVYSLLRKERATHLCITITPALQEQEVTNTISERAGEKGTRDNHTHVRIVVYIYIYIYIYSYNEKEWGFFPLGNHYVFQSTPLNVCLLTHYFPIPWLVQWTDSPIQQHEFTQPCTQ